MKRLILQGTDYSVFQLSFLPDGALNKYNKYLSIVIKTVFIDWNTSQKWKLLNLGVIF